MLLNLQLDALAPLLQIRRQEAGRQVFDPLRGKWLVLQPEEMVRQLLVQHLVEVCGYNRHRISLERQLVVNGLHKRFDLLVYDQSAQHPWMLVECKAPQMNLNQATFRQLATYNLAFRADYLLVCNGPAAYCCAMHYATESWTFLSALPTYP